MVLIIAISIGYSIEREKALVLTGGRDKSEHIIAVPGRTFVLGFIHSVHHTPVHEVIYICDDNTLALKELRFSTLGVGMPYGYEGGELEAADGEFILRFERKFKSINMIISPIPKHTITIGHRTYPLLQFTEPEGPLEIKATDRWSFRLLRLGRKGA